MHIHTILGHILAVLSSIISASAFAFMIPDGSSVLVGPFYIENRTSQCEISIGQATADGAQLGGETNKVLKSMDTAPLSVVIPTGVWVEASRSIITIPASVSCPGKAIESGEIRIYTSGGTSFPSRVIYEINIGKAKALLGVDTGGILQGALGSMPLNSAILTFTNLGAATRDYDETKASLEALDLVMGLTSSFM